MHPLQFLDVYVRQNHPGELRHHYSGYAEKVEASREHQHLEQLPWPVLVDDYAGTVHRRYGGELADPAILLDAEHRVAFYQMWTHIPTLKTAVDGYRGPRRGGRCAVLEYDLGALGAGTLSFLGNKAKPLLAPVALRAEPLRGPGNDPAPRHPARSSHEVGA